MDATVFNNPFPNLAWRPCTERPNGMHFQGSERGSRMATWIVNDFISVDVVVPGATQVCR